MTESMLTTIITVIFSSGATIAVIKIWQSYINRKNTIAVSTVHHNQATQDILSSELAEIRRQLWDKITELENAQASMKEEYEREIKELHKEVDKWQERYYEMKTNNEKQAVIIDNLQKQINELRNGVKGKLGK